MASFVQFHREVTQCERCPRLRLWCKQVGEKKKRAFLDHDYWAKPVPSFGDPKAQVLIVGLAPAAHGANRTGRMFTGDNSGKWLYRALHEHGFANHDGYQNPQDGLKLNNAWITNIVHCAPPQNKPNAEELSQCFDHLLLELGLLENLKVVLTLGKMAWDTTLKAVMPLTHKLKFEHGRVMSTTSNLRVIASYHPSQQNTFTGRLTKPMFDEVFIKVRSYL